MTLPADMDMRIPLSAATRNRIPRRTRSSAGVTLIEVLVTMVIISVGLLGVAAMQVATVRNNYDAFVRSQAAVLAGDMFDRMRANREQALDRGYDIDLDASGSGDTVAGRDVNDWKATLAAQLPSGDGAIATDATGLVTITIQWGERGEDDPLQFVTSSQI